MKNSEFKNKSVKELTDVLNDLMAKLAKLSFEKEANTLKDTSQIKKIKKDIARALTALNRHQYTNVHE